MYAILASGVFCGGEHVECELLSFYRYGGCGGFLEGGRLGSRASLPIFLGSVRALVWEWWPSRVEKWRRG